ncbi:Hypothetical predicted protein [Podarcis lilfordi]|uniref:Uncharacterized protein n=1 Tax=Podarcis lilfordi TaxID=74358 RepID=A0AA35LGM0_9SAUR|nr:Hypothetical predicted protein [Podarcis lilfordi]
MRTTMPAGMWVQPGWPTHEASKIATQSQRIFYSLQHECKPTAMPDMFQASERKLYHEKEGKENSVAGMMKGLHNAARSRQSGQVDSSIPWWTAPCLSLTSAKHAVMTRT